MAVFEAVCVCVLAVLTVFHHIRTLEITESESQTSTIMTKPLVKYV